MNGAQITFYGALSPSPYLIPFTVIHDSIPKTKTVILRLKPGSSVASLGPITTYTYTIHNAPYKTTLSGLAISNDTISFTITNLTASATNYVLRCHDLTDPLWATCHIFSGVSGQLQWAEPFSNGWDRVFYRVICE